MVETKDRMFWLHLTDGVSGLFHSRHVRDECSRALGDVRHTIGESVHRGERGRTLVDLELRGREGGELPPLVPNAICGGTIDPARALARECAGWLHAARAAEATEDASLLAEVLRWLNSQRPRPEWKEGYAESVIEDAIYEFGVGMMHQRMDAAARADEEERRVRKGDEDRRRDAYRG